MFWPFFNSLLGGTAGPDFQSGPDDDQWVFLCLFCLCLPMQKMSMPSRKCPDQIMICLVFFQLKVGEMPTVFIFFSKSSFFRIIWK
jgi:hypothetical protein